MGLGWRRFRGTVSGRAGATPVSGRSGGCPLGRSRSQGELTESDERVVEGPVPGPAGGEAEGEAAG